MRGLPQSTVIAHQRLRDTHPRDPRTGDESHGVDRAEDAVEPSDDLTEVGDDVELRIGGSNLWRPYAHQHGPARRASGA